MARATRIRVTAAVAATLAAVASAPLAVMVLDANGVSMPGIVSADRLMAMLDARSPGERTKGELSASKVSKDNPARPAGRVLGKVFPPKPSPLEQLAQVVVPAPPPAPLPVIPIVPPTAADVIAPSTLIASVGPPIGGGAIIGGGGGFIGGGGGGGGGAGGGGAGGGGGGGGSTPPDTSNGTPPVLSAVPEPGTWLTMLIGFAMIGSAMPRRRTQRVLATAG